MMIAHLTAAMVGLAFGAAAFVPCAQATCAHYDPDVVRLTGHLSIDMKYGPANYGETPGKDQNLHIAILHLAHPLDVCGDSRDVTTADSFKGLQVVQLRFGNMRADPRHYAGKNIA